MQPLCLQERKFQQLSGELREKIPSPFALCSNSLCCSSQYHHNQKPLRLSVSQHCPDTSNCRMQQAIFRNMDPSLSESCVTPLALLPAPAPATSWPPTSSTLPGTPFPAVSRPLCQHLFSTHEHGWGTAGTICRHSEALCPAGFGVAQPWEGLTEVTPAWVHRSRRFRTAPVGKNSLQLCLRNWVWRKTALLCSLKPQPPS